MAYNFASKAYSATFVKAQSLKVDASALRKSALNYIQQHSTNRWYDDPIATIINGQTYKSENLHETVDAFNNVNGRISFADDGIYNNIKSHVMSYKPLVRDYRTQIRAIEEKLLSPDHYAGFLIANQALDFWKQDGVTEMEEATQANVIERICNDDLMRDEENGILSIDRTPALIGCVSNFSNFLDLFRRVIRHIEVGVPVVVLSRGNTSQHCYRWSQLLVQLLEEEGVDTGMITFAALKLEDTKRLLSSSTNCPMYMTSSRLLAKTIKSIHDNTIASTGGPNTMVTSVINEAILDAISMSSTIENSGQCTALRHLIAPCTTSSGAEKLFKKVDYLTSPIEALEEEKFAALFENATKVEFTPDYKKHPKFDIHYRLNDKLPRDNLNEFWRNASIDITDKDQINNSDIAQWLVKNQPITLAVNGDYALAKELFEKTSLVVYTVGTIDQPALSCQARPQEAEIFGELPPRKELGMYTKYPVIVPSSTPAINSSYTKNYLHSLKADEILVPDMIVSTLLDLVKDDCTLGYCVALLAYLKESCGPKTNLGNRTILWGLQRPPLDNSVTVVRLASTKVDDFVPVLLPFLVTNARGNLQVSSLERSKLTDLLENNGIHTLVENYDEFSQRVTESKDGIFNVIDTNELNPRLLCFPLIGNFVSLFFPLGHTKSTLPNDEYFVQKFECSDKWLRFVI